MQFWKFACLALDVEWQVLILRSGSDVDELCLDYADGGELLRMNLSTGRLSQVLNLGNGYYDFTFSSDDTYLAYVKNWLLPVSILI